MKKVVSILLVAILLFGLVVPVASADTNSQVGYFGDYNSDGKINANDALGILKIAVGKLKMDYNVMCYLDVTSDLKVNAQDALDVLKFAVGKLSAFKAADDFGYRVNVMANDVYVQQGGTAVVGVVYDAPNETVRSTYYTSDPVLWVSWDDAWMFPNGNYTTIHISPKISVTKETVIPVKIYSPNHPSLYEVINVHILPEQSEPFSYPAFPGLPDFGDYVKTSPEWADTDFIDNTLTVSLVYDAKTILANGNKTTCYDDFLYLLKDKITFVSSTQRDDGNWLYTFKTEKYTLSLWLMTQDGAQKVFVHMEGNINNF